MEMAFLLLIVLLIAYSVLALFDGVFLHLYKYRLYDHSESKFEHLVHTIRAFLFIGILATLFINPEDNSLFLLGITLVIADMVTLVVDAYAEQDSRSFMGGLPRWEYILHLIVNGIHFASIAVFMAIKINIDNNESMLVSDFQHVEYFHTFKKIAINLLPGAILISLLHILLYLPKFKSFVNKLQLNCC
ncbi:MAG: hypothetical protein JNM21_08130 [Taibaiella sp.]|nr:hypothetical protein [Taibaiella sp.]